MTDDTRACCSISAIAAAEGTTTDGFIVRRSIQTHKSNKWNS